MIENFGCNFLPYPQSLPIIDCYLVSSLKGLYERVLIIFMHIEEFINKSNAEEDCSGNSEGDISNEEEYKSKTHRNIKEDLAVALEREKIVSVREFFSKSDNTVDNSTMEELNFKSFID
jgi:hypothetical protein